MHGQSHELLPAHGQVGLEEVGAAHTLTNQNLLLGQPQGGAVGAHPVHVGVGHLGVGLFDLHLHGGGLGGVAHGVHRHIGEGVLAGLVLIGGVGEGGGAVLRQGDGPPGGLVHQAEGEQVALRVHGGELTLGGHVLIGVQLQVPGDGSGVLSGEQVEVHRHVLPGGAVGEDGGEGEAGGGHGGGVVGGEGHAGDGLHGYRLARGQVHAAQGEHAGVGVGQGGEHDGVQGLLTIFHQKIGGGEGEDLLRGAVFGKGGHGGAVGLGAEQLSRGRQGHEHGEGGHQKQQHPPAQGTGTVQNEDLLW